MGLGTQQGDEPSNSRGHEADTRPWYCSGAHARLDPHVALTPNQREQLVN